MYFIGSIVTFLIMYQILKEEEEVFERALIAIIASLIYPLILALGLFVGFVWSLMLLSDWLFDRFKNTPKFKIKG